MALLDLLLGRKKKKAKKKAKAKRRKRDPAVVMKAARSRRDGGVVCECEGRDPAKRRKKKTAKKKTAKKKRAKKKSAYGRDHTPVHGDYRDGYRYDRDRGWFKEPRRHATAAKKGAKGRKKPGAKRKTAKRRTR